MAANKKYRGLSVRFSLVGSRNEPSAVQLRGLAPSPARVGCALALLVAMAALVFGCNPPGRSELLAGKRLIEQGRPREAIEPLRRAASLFGTNTPAAARAWNWLGLAYHHAGQGNEALEAYQKAIRCDFNLFAARYNLGCLLLEHTNLVGAINELVTYTSHRPNDPSGWLQLGTAQFRAKLYDQSEKTLQRVIDLNAPASDCAEAMNLIGLCRAARRRPQEAIRAFETALNFQSNYAPALLNHAIVAQTQLGNRALAVQKYRDYLDAIGGPANNPSVAALADQLEAAMQTKPQANNQDTLPALTNRIVHALPPPTNVNVVAKPSPQPPTQMVAAVQPAKPPPAQTNVEAAKPQVGVLQKPGPKPVLESSNAVAATVPDQTKPPETAAVRPQDEAGTNAVAQERKVEQPAVPVELVKLQEEPEVKPATTIQLPPRPLGQTQQVASAAPPAAASAPQFAQTNRTVAATTAQRPPTIARVEEPTPPRRSWVGKLNPLNLFRSGSKPPAEQPSPAPQPAAHVLPTAATQGPAQPPPETPSPERPRPSFPRYSYLTPAMPPSGNRALAESHYAAGLAAQKSGSLAQAIRSYQEAVAADPAYFEAHYNLGVAAFDARNWQIALQAYENALALKPNDFGARLNFALTLEKAGYPVDAANELEALLSQHPDKAEVHFAAANLYAQVLDDKSMARAHYSRVLELDPRHPQASAIRRWLLANRAR